MKKPTPKKKQSHSSSSRRHKAFQAKARKKLFRMADSMLKLRRLGKAGAPKKSTASKVTTIKA